ncbi:hypothetical protein LINGRAHAP2_LOCUS16498 [Linum grandiflorum]
MDLLRPFFGRRRAEDEHGNEFWVRLCYEGLPPVCYKCGRMGHNHGRCPDSVRPLNLEERGPWMSLPTSLYRRVNAFTFQPDGPSHRPREGSDLRRPVPLVEPRLDLQRSAALRQMDPPLRVAGVPYRSDASSGPPPRSRLVDGSSSHREAARAVVAAGKRPLETSVIPTQRRDRLVRPASPDSVGSSTAASPPGFASACMAMAEGGPEVELGRPLMGFLPSPALDVGRRSPQPSLPLVLGLAAVEGPLPLPTPTYIPTDVLLLQQDGSTAQVVSGANLDGPVPAP